MANPQKNILLPILPSLSNPLTTVVLLRSQWWDAGGTENHLQIVSIHVHVTFTHFNIASNKENWSFWVLIWLSGYEPLEKELDYMFWSVLYQTDYIVELLTTNASMNVSDIKYCTSKFNCYGSYVVGWVFLDELQVWTYSICKFVYQYRDFFNKSYAHDFNVPCGKTQVGCCFLRDMLLLLFAHSFKFKYMQSVSHGSL